MLLLADDDRTIAAVTQRDEFSLVHDGLARVRDENLGEKKVGRRGSWAVDADA